MHRQCMSCRYCHSQADLLGIRAQKVCELGAVSGGSCGMYEDQEGGADESESATVY